ncbi:MAG TPA: glycosyltransferase, partial [Ktedonobacteraceae bacterium]|nr:glycosyltransferase [Ktedonobacteraceae bacterium]
MQTHPVDQNPERQSDSQARLAREIHFEQQVASYRTWLSTQSKKHASQVLQERREYAQRAMRTVEVGNKRIQTFAPFRYKFSALQTITRKQVVSLSLIGAIWAVCMIWNWSITLAVTISLITLLYLSHLILDVFVALRAVQNSGEEQIDEALLTALKDADWPPYTVLCPLYKEPQVISQFVKAMKELDYPEEKLQILFLTEEDDQETRRAILALHLPHHFHVITVPDGSPRTKPRACNYGLVEATGAYVVIYDAEDVPDPLQLKKAVITFAIHGHNLACVQARLNFYNADQNLLTRWFTAEYSLWFDLILPGLQKTNLAIPLGGTSNHFPTQTLRALGGWDAFNVTEDCDLGIRLSWFNLKTVIVNSTTFEEANSRTKNWIRQRSRWVKGYMQTYLVHMREPTSYFRQHKLREFFSMQFLVGGKSLILLINPLMWLLLSLTLLFHQNVASAFEHLFPPVIIFIGGITLILGNFFYGYIYLLGCMKRQQYTLVKWMLLIPCYWFLTSVAASMALYELCKRPHYWQKTIHGLHLKPTEEQDIPVETDSANLLQKLAQEYQDRTEWERMAELAELLTPLPAEDELRRGSGPHAINQIQRYDTLDHVPVPSVKDTI